MKHILLLGFFTAFFCFCSFAQDTSALKRPAYKLTVAVDKESVYEADIASTPYVLPNKAVQLYPGETVYLEVEQENGEVKSIRAVKEIKDPSKTLTVSFTQSAKANVHEMMMLKVQNPFPERLIYKCRIFLLGRNKWANTDVYPVEANIGAYETWPDVITSIALAEWNFEKR